MVGRVLHVVVVLQPPAPLPHDAVYRAGRSGCCAVCARAAVRVRHGSARGPQGQRLPLTLLFAVYAPGKILQPAFAGLRPPSHGEPPRAAAAPSSASPPSAANLDAEKVLETSTCMLSTRLRKFVPVLESQNNPFFVTTYYGQFSLSASHLPTA